MAEESQSNQLISLSWQYALLFPCWVRPISSPPSTIRTPCEKTSVAMKLRFMRSRIRWTGADSVGPSAPQFRL